MSKKSTVKGDVFVNIALLLNQFSFVKRAILNYPDEEFNHIVAQKALKTSAVINRVAADKLQITSKENVTQNCIKFDENAKFNGVYNVKKKKKKSF